jgi:hypothetical protein
VTLPDEPTDAMYTQIAEKYPNPDDPACTALLWFMDCWRATLFADQPQALDEFWRVLHGEALEPSNTAPDLVAASLAGSNGGPVWAPLKTYGNVSDIARVRPDLLSSKGWTLNGRVGKIAGMRRGDVILVFDRPVLDGPDEYRGPAEHFDIDISGLQE